MGNNSGQERTCSDKHEKMNKWVAEHDGRINAWWESQRRWNKGVEKDVRDIFTRVRCLEHRVIFASGFIGCIGAIIGAVAVYLKTKP